jgi:hypothetical protein
MIRGLLGGMVVGTGQSKERQIGSGERVTVKLWVVHYIIMAVHTAGGVIENQIPSIH